MHILKSLLAHRTASGTAELVAEIVHRSCPTIWARVQHRAMAMRPAEARGYIRARAAEVLQTEAQAVFRRHDVRSAAVGERLTQQAGDALVNSLHAEVLRSQSALGAKRRAA